MVFEKGVKPKDICIIIISCIVVNAGYCFARTELIRQPTRRGVTMRPFEGSQPNNQSELPAGLTPDMLEQVQEKLLSLEILKLKRKIAIAEKELSQAENQLIMLKWELTKANDELETISKPSSDNDLIRIEAPRRFERIMEPRRITPSERRIGDIERTQPATELTPKEQNFMEYTKTLRLYDPDFVKYIGTLKIYEPNTIPPYMTPRAIIADYSEGNYAVMNVFYGTNRIVTTDNPENPVYGTDPGNIHYGQCTVSVPRDHRMGHMEAPVIDLDFLWDPEKHVMVTNTTMLNETDFFNTNPSALAAGQFVSQCSRCC